MGVKGREQTRKRKLKSTAYHEAGHAVVSFFLHRPFRFVTIKPGGDSLGRMVGRPSDYRRRLRMAEKGYIDVVDACIAAAGCEAEKKLTGRYNHRGAGKDYDAILDIARGVGEDGGGRSENSPMAKAIADASFKEARYLLNQPWAAEAVREVAKELLRRETLNHETFVSLMMATRKGRV